MTYDIDSRVNDMRQSAIILFATASLFVITYSLCIPMFSAMSKIDDGVVIERGDTITTVVIPDIR